MTKESVIYAKLAGCVDWVGKHWFLVRRLLLLCWLIATFAQWVLLRITSEWIITMYWLTTEIARVLGGTLVAFLLLENWILRIQIRKQDVG